MTTCGKPTQIYKSQCGAESFMSVQRLRVQVQSAHVVSSSLLAVWGPRLGFLWAGAEGQLDPPILKLLRQDISVARGLRPVKFNDRRVLTSSYPPDAFVFDHLREPCGCRGLATGDPEVGQAEGLGRIRTFQESRGKVDAHVGVPPGVGPRVDRLRDSLCLDLVEVDEDPVAGAEADDDLGHAEQKGLDSVLHELAVKDVHVPVTPDLGARLQLDPVDGRTLLRGLGVPDLGASLATSTNRRQSAAATYWRQPRLRDTGWLCRFRCGRWSSTVPCC